MSLGRLSLTAAVVMAAASCSDSTGANVSGIPGYGIVSVQVEPSSATMYVPDTIRATDRLTFNAFATGRTGATLQGIAFAWSSSDPTIAVVDSTGVVTPVRPGTVEITASAHKIGKATLVILPATQRVSVAPQLDSIFVDDPIVSTRDTTLLSASALDVFGKPLTGVAYTWTSASAAVATVTASGEVRAVGLGTTAVTVIANGGTSAVSSIRVVPVVASLTVSSPATQVLAFDTLKLAAVSRDYGNALMTRKYSWTSSNPSVATVDSTGRVNFLTTGSATFTARTAHRTSAATVTALPRVLTSIDAGSDFTCGFTNLGRGYCWGLASAGRTGVEPDSLCLGGLTAAEPCILPPKRMNRPELSFTSISSGGSFACGIATDQNLYCWGSDQQGQIGNGNKGAGATPSLTTVKSERFAAVSAGRQHACALNLAGRAYCWGDDSRGQLGDNRTIISTTPIPIADSTLVFTMISAGDAHTCGVTTSGQAFCWGENASGQLGNGTTVMSDVPVQVSGGANFRKITAGKSHTCAIDETGAAFCWGSNASGQLGNAASAIPQLTPIQVSGAGGYTAISAGENHTCALAGTEVRCWGRSEFGEVGDGIVSPHTVAAPTTVAGIAASTISAGTRHTCAITTTGAAMCWGSNVYGALGNEFQAAVRATPQVVARPR